MKRIVLPKKPLIWFIFLNCFNCLNAQTTYYVDASRLDNTGAGTSWATAKKDVQNAIATAASGDQIWVKAGIYKPTQDPFGNTAPADPRDKTFLIKNGVKLYGGFAGTETLLSQRNPSLNVTQLSGDIGSAAVTDNCYHVVISLTSTSATVLDGFIVTSGYGVGAGNITVSGISISRYDGAGIYIRDGSPVINNCTVKDNTIDDVTGNDDTRGAGIYCWNSAPTVSNCVIANNTFLQNSFGCFGAGIGLFGNGVPQITNTYFYNNVTPPGMLGGAPGGGLYAEYSSPIITNCVFYGNVADNGGAIAVNGPSSPTITNCTLNNNTARYNGSGVVYFVVGSGIIKNTIFWNNPTTLTSYLNRMEIFSANTTATKPVITNCLVRDAVGAPLTVTNTVMSNCINANPQFFNAADPDGVDNRIGTTDDGLMLLNTSPAINVGATGAGIPLTDMALQTRDAQPDMGAYEYITPCTVPTVFTVTGGGTVCAGSGAAVSLSGSQSGISYQLKLNGSNQGSPLTGNGGVLNFGTQTLAGNYAVVATNTAGAGCSAAMNGTVTITVNSTSAPSGSASQTFCAGATLANVVVSGTAIKWYTASVAGSLLSTTTALANGTSYYASQTLNGCESSTRLMVTVVVNPLPVISVNSGSICSGNAFTIVPTGASTYTIQGGNNVVSPLTNSTYTVSGTSAAGCISSGFVTSSVTVNALPVISVNSGSICSGNTFTIVPTGASTYTIQGGSNVVSPLANATYTVKGTSAAGCVSSGFVTSSVTVNALPVISVNSGSICSGNAFTIVPTGASTYTIQGGSNVVSPLANATYTVKGTSAAGCISSGFVTSSVTVNALPVISVNSGSICSGNTFTIVPTGASTYTIQGGNNVVSPLTNSTYTVSGTSAAGCVSSGFVISSVTVNALPVISVNSGSICSGNAFTIVPTGAATYTIQGGNNVVSPLTNSTYTVSGTSAAGCVSSGFVTSSVTVNALPVISVNSGSICSGNAFTIVPTGAATYTIQGGNNVVSPLTNSTYTVSGTSAAGCVSSGFVTSSVTVNALPVISVNSGSICAGNTFTIVPTGASTYTIQGGSNVVSPLTNSTYTVSGTSAAGCVFSGFVTSSVTVSALPVITIQSTQSLLCVGQSATLSATGATSYTWNPSIPLNGSISPSVTSSYTVNGTNVSGCSNSAVFTQSVSLCTSVPQRINTEERFRILPNPSAGIFTLEALPDTKIELRDVLGKILLETVMLSDQLTLNITDQPSGIYFLSIQQNGRIKVIRLIKS